MGILPARYSSPGSGQACRSWADVEAGATREREGARDRAYIDTRDSPPVRKPLCEPGQAGRGRVDVPVCATRLWEGAWYR